jgi:hypothetical protein
MDTFCRSVLFVCAEGNAGEGTRTLKSVRTTAPKAVAYTNSATPAHRRNVISLGFLAAVRPIVVQATVERPKGVASTWPLVAHN